jgi:hypothetical protein
MTDNNNNNHECWRTDGNNVDANDWLGTRNNQPLRIRTNNTQRMIITPAGNVGIGTETPETATGGLALHIHNPNGASALRLGDGAVNGQQWEWQSTVINNVGAMNLSKLTPPLANPLTVLANGNVGIGTTTPQGRLDVLGDIRAGNSDIYFTEQNHNHTGIGNTAGFAAIENAVNYNALMILGRAGTPRGRMVRLWDYLQVNGGMDVTGNVEFLSASNPIRVSSGWTAFPDPVTNRAEISNDTGTFRTLMIVGNRSAGLGRRVSVWDRLEVNGSLHVTGAATKPGGGPWSSSSDVRLKKSIRPLKSALEKLSRLRGVSFEWKEPEKQGNLRGAQMGLVAQEVEEVFPEWVDVDPSGYKILTVRGFEALTIEAFRELKAENKTLKMKNEELEDRIMVLELPISERQPSGSRNGAVR